MTDHSILTPGLTPGLPELPFQEEARLITRVITFFGTKVPMAFRSAIAVRDIYEAMSGLNDEQLAALGIERTGIPAFAAKKAGLLDL